MTPPPVISWCESVACCDEQWEQAYRDFETPAEEIRKFHRRYQKLGVDRFPRDSRVVELFCGRGNGLVALEQLGFTRLEGVDLSAELLQQYAGPAQLYVGDCRELRFEAESKDLVVVQGGLHHLPSLPDDLAAVLREVRRVLHEEGHLVVVEPWDTPFLRWVHTASERRLLRRSWPKIDAFARMTERELTTYQQWLRQPQALLGCFEEHFLFEIQRVGWGKLMLVARPRPQTSGSVT